MKTSFELAAEFRDAEGKGASRRLRRANKVPAILYGGHREPRALALTPDERFLAVADAGTSSLAVLIAEPSRLADSRSAMLTSLPVGTRPVDVVVPNWNRNQNSPPE